jgi:acyl-CoA hydrolase
VRLIITVAMQDIVPSNSVRCDTTLIFLEYEIVAMGRRSMNVDVAVMC